DLRHVDPRCEATGARLLGTGRQRQARQQGDLRGHPPPRGAAAVQDRQVTFRVAAMASAIAVAVALAGCGLGAGKGTSDVAVTVTHDFGTASVGSANESRVPGSQTVMRLLERSFRVNTRFGGGFVQSIDGRSGTTSRRD